MAQLFSDIPEALINTVEIARRCSLELTLGKSVLPAYPVPSQMSTEDFPARGVRARACDAARAARCAASVGRIIPREEYEARLQTELGVICQMGFAGYFLIVADFIRWARENGVPVGPGRGSGAGSLVAYALAITDLDPLQYDLLFERFLNPERVSMPDFDVDFCMDGRDRVIEYVAERYGRERVSQIITYGTMAAKAVVRDVARVYRHELWLRRFDREAHSVRTRHHAQGRAGKGAGAQAPVRQRRGDAAPSSTWRCRSKDSCATPACMRAAWSLHRRC